MNSLISDPSKNLAPFRSQLIKWIGNKQRFADEIISYFPRNFKGYYEPFLGSGAVLGTLAPTKGFGSDTYQPLIGIWEALVDQPETLIDWYTRRYEKFVNGADRRTEYEKIKSSFNKDPNPEDFIFLTRSCYGGVIRFRKDGYMSTPLGIHDPISPESFTRRVKTWNERTRGTTFKCCDFREAISSAKKNDLIYCDPPYVDSQSILYGAQDFTLDSLLNEIDRAKSKGVFIALSIDGTKKSGNRKVKIDLPADLFPQTKFVNCGTSMLRRFQIEGKTSVGEAVKDKLLLSWR